MLEPRSGRRRRGGEECAKLGFERLSVLQVPVRERVLAGEELLAFGEFDFGESSRGGAKVGGRRRRIVDALRGSGLGRRLRTRGGFGRPREPGGVKVGVDGGANGAAYDLGGMEEVGRRRRTEVGQCRRKSEAQLVEGDGENVLRDADAKDVLGRDAVGEELADDVLGLLSDGLDDLAGARKKGVRPRKTCDRGYSPGFRESGGGGGGGTGIGRRGGEG